MTDLAPTDSRDATLERAYAEQLKANIHCVERHVASEYSNDVDHIMTTVHAVPRYALVSKQNGVPELTVLNDRDAVAGYYAWSRQASHEPVATRHPKQITTDWYLFLEALPSRRAVEGGTAYLTHYVLLFPTASDGIVGEIMWQRTGFDVAGEFVDADIVIQEPFPASDVRTLRTFEELGRAAEAGDRDAVAAAFAEECQSALPTLEVAGGELVARTGSAPAIDWLMRVHRAGPEGTSLCLNAVSGSWYHFEERLVEVPELSEELVGVSAGEPLTLRYAVLYVLDGAGRIAGVSGILKLVR
jgi:hypothetical protein